MKVLLIVVDGMRPDAMIQIPKARDLMKKSTYTLKGRTVFVSATLPAHMSLFHSVDPERHGTLLNVFVPQVRPVRGLCEVLRENGKHSALFYTWEPLRDLTRPGSVDFAYYYSAKVLGYEKTNLVVTDAAIKHIATHDTDFIFLYLANTDTAGHRYGWMSKEYMDSIEESFNNIGRIMETLDEEWSVIVLSDHGGNGRHHGTDSDEDMTIPLLFIGKDFEKGKELPSASIKDVAPTIAKLFGIAPDEDWEGQSVL
ncbi:MAG: alkaline phosphatase family protein [Clostridia bacterium]|nr:alkaline phosphatase family protein [Clostridia bacterium]